MSQLQATTTIEDLLEHAGWLRHLASKLVYDEADDAVQESWLAALRSPPDANRSPRPWLARVLQNATRKRFRENTSRQALEKSVAALTDEAPTPEQIASRAETHRLIVDLVLALKEPLRRVVLLRYFEGLSSAEIARRLEVPAGTIRWRLKEGIHQLRAALDVHHQGDRHAWLILIKPLTFAPDGRLSALNSGLATMAMKSKITILGGVALLIGTLGTLSMRCAESMVDSDVVRAQQQGDESQTQKQLPKTRGKRLTASQDVGQPDTIIGLAPSGGARSHSAPNTSEALFPVLTNDDASRRALHGIDSVGIRAAVNEALPQVRDCYEEWLKVQPNLGGRVRATFTIDTDDGVEGKVERVSLGDAGLGHFAMEGCILAALQSLRFNAPMDGPINVTYPLNLVPNFDGGLNTPP